MTELLRQNLVAKLAQISEEAQRMASNSYGNSSEAQGDLMKFSKQFASWFEFVSDIKDPKASDLVELTESELQKIRNHIKLLTVREPDFEMADIVVPCCMSLAASVKYFISLSDQPAEVTESTTTLTKDNSEVSLANSSTSKNELSTEEAPSSTRPKSQLAVDIISFVKACGTAIAYLQSTPVQRIALFNKVIPIVASVRSLINDEAFSQAISKQIMASFIEAVKEVQEIKKDVLDGTPIIEKFLFSLKHMARAIKSAALKKQQDRLSPSRSSSNLTGSHSPLGSFSDLRVSPRGSEVSLDLRSRAPSEGTQSFTSQMQKMTTNEPENSLSDDSIAEDSVSTRFKIIHDDKLTRMVGRSPSSSLSRPSRARSESTEPDNEGALSISSFVPLSARIEKKQILVEVEVQGMNQSTNEIETAVMEYSEGEIERLSNDINSFLPGFLKRISFEQIRRNAGRVQACDVAVNECFVMFNAMCGNKPILTSFVVQTFFQSAFFDSDQVHPISSKHRESQDQLNGGEGGAVKRTSGGKTTTRTSAGGFTGKNSILKLKESIKSMSMDNLPAPQSGTRTDRSNAITLGRTSSSLTNLVKDKRSKYDPVRKTGSFQSLAISSKPRFSEYSSSIMAEGFIATADNTLVLRDVAGNDLIVIKNVENAPYIESATITAILDRVLIESITDITLFQSFILGYRHFLKPNELLIKLVEKYHDITERRDPNAEAGFMHVASFLYKWVEAVWSDFDRSEQLREGLNKMLGVIRSSKKIAPMADQIETAAKEQEEISESEKRVKGHKTKKQIVTNVGQSPLTAQDAYHVAVQLTKIESDYYVRTKKIEYLEYIWEPETKDSSVRQWVDRFNQVSYWVGTEICTTPLLKERVKVLEQMIKILKTLKEIHNYNGVMAVLAGLNSSAVKRLKKTWNSIGSRSTSTLAEIERIMDPKMNYQAYREVESKYRGKESFIPFIGLYLKDLTFANDGNPKTLENGLFNFSKVWIMYGIVQRLQSFQDPEYDFPEDAKLLQYCRNLIALPEKRLYSYSLLCEARKKEVTSEDSVSDNIRLIEKWSQT